MIFSGLTEGLTIVMLLQTHYNRARKCTSGTYNCRRLDSHYETVRSPGVWRRKNRRSLRGSHMREVSVWIVDQRNLEISQNTILSKGRLNTVTNLTVHVSSFKIHRRGGLFYRIRILFFYYGSNGSQITVICLPTTIARCDPSSSSYNNCHRYCSTEKT